MKMLREFLFAVFAKTKFQISGILSHGNRHIIYGS